jgi:hypothetical protein
MIIGRDEIHDVAGFGTALAAAATSVVRAMVRSNRRPNGGWATGWQLTDTLVVIPRFLLPDADARDGLAFSCVRGEQTVDGRLEFDGGDGDPSASRPALVRLARPLEGPTLPLASADPAVGDQVLVFQYASDPKLQFSVGRCLASSADGLRYDADTRPGAAGGPVLDADWAVVGVHMSSGTATELPYNEGLPLAALLGILREADSWHEIAARHRLVDLAAMRRAPEQPPVTPAAADELLEAAVRWEIDPSELEPGTVAQLEPLVVEPSSDTWALPATERISLLRAAPSVEALRDARGPAPVPGIGQVVIDRILKGPPFSLEDVPEGELPYWLQATDWFAGVVPALPTPDDVRLALERKRMRSRLEAIGGEGFRGRADELATLNAWYRDPAAGPMVLSGIGGVGKSALVARFVLQLPEDTLQLWLDFDRADLAPDDAASVLRVIFEQLATQHPGVVAPVIDATTWQGTITQLGKAVGPALAGAPPPLLVLDGFEVAQHAIQHREIWHLLEQLLPQVPGVRVLVSGRAPVTGLTLSGREAKALHLEGLSQPEATAWLLDNGFEDSRVAARVAEITRGVPLALRLAARWRAEGGDPAELPEGEAPQWMIDGFLYDRILDRVVNQRLKKLASDALVLRRVTAEMIPAVLGDSAPVDVPADEVFEALAREMALVGDGTEGHGLDFPRLVLPGTAVLQLRPEVRSATLQLLATDKPARVREIDERAAAWYAKQDPDDIVNAAELVYHRLRLGDLDGAALAWRDGCAPLLLYAEDELPDKAARDWLLNRTKVPASGPTEQLAWERDACDRLQALLLRGVLPSVDSVLAERTERSPGSALIVYDALSRHWNGDREGARTLLDAAEPAHGTAGRDRAVVRAWLAAETGDREGAERWLAELEPLERWGNRPDPALDALTVTAARVRLAIDLHAELLLAELLREVDDPESIRVALEVVLPPSDVVMPVLSDQVGTRRGLESYGEQLSIPTHPDELQRFTFDLDDARRRNTRDMALPVAGDDAPAGPETKAWRDDVIHFAMKLADSPSPRLEHGLALGVDLEVLARRRWRCVASRLFLAGAVGETTGLKLGGDPQRLAIVGALASFAGHARSTFRLFDDRVGPLNELFAKLSVEPELLLAGPPLPSWERFDFAARVLGFLRAPLDALSRQSDMASIVQVQELVQMVHGVRSKRPELVSLLFLLLSPEPLEMLVRRVAGVPDSLSI